MCGEILSTAAGDQVTDGPSAEFALAGDPHWLELEGLFPSGCPDREPWAPGDPISAQETGKDLLRSGVGGMTCGASI